MIVYELNTWEELRIQLLETAQINTGPGSKSFANFKIYRGQMNSDWKLISKMERITRTGSIVGHPDQTLKKLNGFTWYKNEYEQTLFRFKQNLKKLSDDYRQISDVDAWIIGRHYGLNSPLLDWTTNAYKALFFAFEDLYFKFGLSFNFPENKNVVCLYKLNGWPDLFTENELEYIEPVDKIGTRMNAQSCCFTNLKTEHDGIEEYLVSKNKSDYLEKYLIPSHLTKEIISYLFEIGITPFTMYPDLTGAAWDANAYIHRAYSFYKMKF